MADKKNVITELTEDQKILMEKMKAEWEVHSKVTDPADFERGEKAISGLYTLMDKKTPLYIRLHSPLAIQIAIAAFKKVFLSDTESSKQTSAVNPQWKDLFAISRENIMRDIAGNLERNNIEKKVEILHWADRYLSGEEHFDFVNTSLWGFQDAYWISFYLFCQDIGFEYEDRDQKILALWSEIGKSNGWWWPFELFCFICDRPQEIHFNSRNFLHNSDGAAVSFRDGYKIYLVNGVKVPGRIIENPETITVEDIEKETNTEVRRVMWEKFEMVNGKGSYIKMAGATVIGTDDWGTLYKKEMGEGSEPLIMVEVLNSSKEPDGSWKTYFLQVPERGGADWSHTDQDPLIESPQQAIAWTFGKLKNDYNPHLQT